MILKLTTSSTGPAEGPIPAPLVIDRRGAAIGRAAQCDIVLPDSANWISSRHCTIEWRAGAYLLTDTSTNGTIVNGERLSAPHILGHGDTIAIGNYRLQAQIASAAAASSQGAGSPASTGGAAEAATRLLQAAGLARGDVSLSDAAVLTAAGALLRQLTAGTAVLAQQRAKARKELGLAVTADPGNPLLSGAAPAAILSQLLGAAPKAAADQTATALRTIDAHQRAALQAMQGALRSTLDSISPGAIRKRVGGDDAALWRAYEAAFSDSGTDSRFVETFARELAAAYERVASGKA